MDTLLLGLAAGILTVAAPCVLPLLPVIVGGTIAGGAGGARARWRPWVIAGSLAASVTAFTLLLKATTALLGVPPQVWQTVSGVVIVALGVNLLFPSLWDRFSARLGLQRRSNDLLQRSTRRAGLWGTC